MNPLTSGAITELELAKNVFSVSSIICQVDYELFRQDDDTSFTNTQISISGMKLVLGLDTYLDEVEFRVKASAYSDEIKYQSVKVLVCGNEVLTNKTMLRPVNMTLEDNGKTIDVVSLFESSRSECGFISYSLKQFKNDSSGELEEVKSDQIEFDNLNNQVHIKSEKLYELTLVF